MSARTMAGILVNADKERPTKDVYARVTDAILAQMEKGVSPWTQPWTGHRAGPVARPLRSEGTPYRGVNVLVLWAAAATKGYSCPYWMTFQQALALGGSVRKGEKGTGVVYAGAIVKEGKTPDEDPTKIPFLKGYTVFNAEQCDGLPERYLHQEKPVEGLLEVLDKVESFVRQTKVEVVSGGTEACYVPSLDVVRMPRMGVFRSAEGYYATLLHELTHWTKNEKRLDRVFGAKRFGDDGYAVEELVAELGSAFLCADLGVSNDESREDHAAYLAHWVKVLRADSKAIFTAASHAQRAADYLHALQPKAEEAS